MSKDTLHAEYYDNVLQFLEEEKSSINEEQLYETLKNLVKKYKYIENEDERKRDVARFNKFMKKIPKDEYVWTEKDRYDDPFDESKTFGKELLKCDIENYDYGKKTSTNPSFGWGIRMKRDAMERPVILQNLEKILKTYKVIKVKTKWEDGEYVTTKIISILDIEMKIRYYKYSSTFKSGGAVIIHAYISNYDEELFSFAKTGFEENKYVLNYEIGQIFELENDELECITTDVFIDMVLFLSGGKIKYVY
jgi:hypothetical protein